MVDEAPRRGCCGSCRHAREVVSRRGSVFVLCRRSATDPRFPRYPSLPMIRCAGYEPTGDTALDQPVPREST